MAVHDYQVTYDQIVMDAQARAALNAQPCPQCFKNVSPSNYIRHWELEHADIPMPFDYAMFDIETRITLRQWAKEIKTLVRETVQNIVDIGEKLTDAKQSIPHGQFLQWIDVEFGWTPRAAQKLMSTYEAFKSANLSAFHLGRAALYLLSAKSTPESARREAIDRMEGGEWITVPKAQQIVASHKPTPQIERPIEDEKEATRLISVALKATAKELGVPADNTLAKAMGNSLATVIRTNTVEDGNGEQIEVSSAFLSQTATEVTENIKRQKTYMHSEIERKKERKAAQLAAPETTTPTYLFETERTANGLFYVTVRYGMFANAADANAALIQLQKRIEKDCTK